MPDVSKLVEVVGSLSVVAPESCGRPGVMNFRCPRWGPRCDSHGAGICTATMDWVMERVNVWVNYNDLTATSLKSWLIREIIPNWPYFRLVKYYNLPRNVGIHIPSAGWKKRPSPWFIWVNYHISITWNSSYGIIGIISLTSHISPWLTWVIKCPHWTSPNH
jgi:hypothetical protein